MTFLIPRWHRISVPERGITGLAGGPLDRQSRVLHLCRYPRACCTICDRHRQHCRHPTGRQSW